MRRRALLAALGGAATVGVAGCADALPLSGSGSSLPESQDSGEPGGWPDADPDVGPDTDPDPDALQSETVRGYDEVDPGDVDVSLEPSADSVADGGSIEFVLRNDGDENFTFNRWRWRLFKHVEDEWFSLGPDLRPLQTWGIPPGESHTWTLTVDNTGIEGGSPVPHVEGTADLTFAGLGGGHYAFGVSGSFGEVGEDFVDDIGLATRFELDTGPIQITPSNAVEETTQEDDVLVVTTARPDSDESYPAVYELERVAESSGEPTAIITEQVLRDDQLRDTLALAHEHDADRVRIEGETTVHPPFGVDEPEEYEYQGSYYRVTTRERDAS